MFDFRWIRFKKWLVLMLMSLATFSIFLTYKYIYHHVDTTADAEEQSQVQCRLFIHIQTCLKG